MEHGCSKQVSWGWQRHACPNLGKYEEGGKWYCGQHLPSKVRARREERDRKLKAKWDADQAARSQVNAKRIELERRASYFGPLLAALREAAGEYARHFGPEANDMQKEWAAVIAAAEAEASR